MLAPAERRLLLDVLAPPEGYALDHALGTTYTLDLLALLRVPLAATALPWSGAQGEPVNNPFALLTALRRNAGKVSLYCHAGATKVPARHIPLLAFLEDAVHPVTPPKSGGVFHPKLWLLRFTPDVPEDGIRYRLNAVVVELVGDRAVLEFEDGSRREVSAPGEIQIAVGMSVRMIGTGDDAPIIAWGV
jgi:hypothetical protein